MEWLRVELVFVIEFCAFEPMTLSPLSFDCIAWQSWPMWVQLLHWLEIEQHQIHKCTLRDLQWDWHDQDRQLEAL